MKLIYVFLILGLFSCVGSKKKSKTKKDIEIHEVTNINQSGITIDSSATNKIIITKKDETKETVTEITPLENEEITVNADGSFKGKAKTIKTTVKEKKVTDKLEQKDTIALVKSDTSKVQKKQEKSSNKSIDVEIEKKTKTPIWLVLLAIFIGLFLLWRFKVI